jgi:hypothetical protein
MSPLRSYFTPKSSTTRVKELGCEVCFQRPGVFLTLLITVQCKAFAKKLVCKDASLRQTPNCLLHLEVHIPANNFGQEVVLCNDPGGKEADWHLRVFVAVKSSHEVKISDVEAHVACIRGAQNNVPVEFGGRHVSSARGEFSGVVDRISSSRNSDLMGVLFCGQYAMTTLA